ncbi:MAG: hypothetical protein U5R31_04780 [Acidimicrobiia bacterium]|nr:hypothetical protein [Acidimicrobiia bacterium]
MTPTEERQFDAVAKQVLAFLHEHGYDDAAIMPDAGQGAFDIGSAKGIVEVSVASPPNRPEIQRLDGVAAAPRNDRRCSSRSAASPGRRSSGPTTSTSRCSPSRRERTAAPRRSSRSTPWPRS